MGERCPHHLRLLLSNPKPQPLPFSHSLYLSCCLSHSVALLSVMLCFSPLSLALPSLLCPLILSLTSLYLAMSASSLSLHHIFFFARIDLSIYSLSFPSSLSSRKPSKNLRLLSWPARTALCSSELAPLNLSIKINHTSNLD